LFDQELLAIELQDILTMAADEKRTSLEPPAHNQSDNSAFVDEIIEGSELHPTTTMSIVTKASISSSKRKASRNAISQVIADENLHQQKKVDMKISDSGANKQKAKMRAGLSISSWHPNK
jgi:hypothetical protein